MKTPSNLRHPTDPDILIEYRLEDLQPNRHPPATPPTGFVRRPVMRWLLRQGQKIGFSLSASGLAGILVLSALLLWIALQNQHSGRYLLAANLVLSVGLILGLLARFNAPNAHEATIARLMVRILFVLSLLVGALMLLSAIATVVNSCDCF